MDLHKILHVARIIFKYFFKFREYLDNTKL